MPRPPSTPAPGPESEPEEVSPALPLARAARRLAVLRLGALFAAIAIVAALLLVAGRGSLSADRVRDWVDDYGALAPVVFVALSAALTCVLFPGPLLAGASGLLFGTAVGFPVTLTAATLGAVCAFSIGRRVGYEPVERLAGPRVQRARGWIGQRGFLSVLYARIAPGVPYTIVNYLAGLTPVGLGAFAAATALGAAPRAFAYTALGGSFGNFGSWQTVAAVGVLVVMAVVGAVFLRRDLRAGRDPA